MSIVYTSKICEKDHFPFQCLTRFRNSLIFFHWVLNSFLKIIFCCILFQADNLILISPSNSCKLKVKNSLQHLDLISKIWYLAIHSLFSYYWVINFKIWKYNFLLEFNNSFFYIKCLIKLSTRPCTSQTYNDFQHAY